MISYDWPRECLSVWGWLIYSWHFTNSYGRREWGFRLLGLVLSNEKEAK